MSSTATTSSAHDIARPAVCQALAIMETELARTHALLGDLGPADWQRPTDCAGWTVHDVVAHMIGQYEELARPGRLIRRVRRARAIPGTGVLDRHNQVQVGDRASASGQQLIAELGYWGPKAARTARRIPAPLRRRMRLSLFFPEARRMAEDSLDFLIRVIAARDAWMHRTDIAAALARPLALDAHDAQIIRQVVRDLAAAWAGPPVVIHLTGPAGGQWWLGEGGPAGGQWSLGEGGPAATVRSDPVSYLRLASGRPATQPAIDGEAATATALLATYVEF